jgi:hypothetical protein
MSGTGVHAALCGQGVNAHLFDTGTGSLADLAAQQFDRLFIALHGRYGEDGTLQGALELLGIPYTGSGPMASSLAMDKVMTKRVWLEAGLPTPGYRVLTDASEVNAAALALGLPLMMKAPHEGSTLGIVKATEVAELTKAYEGAAQYDEVVLAEQFVAGRELARSQLYLQMLAVNGRVIRVRQLAHAIRLAYDDALPEGRHPCYALQLEIRPEDVDVNVHPGKLEVRFRDLREVHDLVHSAVRAALRTAPEIPSLVSYRPPAFAAQPTLGLGSVQARETAHPTSPRRDAPDPETEWLTLLAERYAVLREGQSLVLVDLICFVQGVLAARMRTELQASTSLPSRPLLFPVRIECVDEAAAQRLGADLQALGLTLNPLGPKTLALRALPRVAPEVDAERLGRALAGGGGVSTSDDLAAALAAAVTIPALANERTQWWQRWLAQASEAGIAPELFIRRLDAAALEQLTGRRNG